MKQIECLSVIFERYSPLKAELDLAKSRKDDSSKRLNTIEDELAQVQSTRTGLFFLKKTYWTDKDRIDARISGLESRKQSEYDNFLDYKQELIDITMDYKSLLQEYLDNIVVYPGDLIEFQSQYGIEAEPVDIDRPNKGIIISESDGNRNLSAYDYDFVDMLIKERVVGIINAQPVRKFEDRILTIATHQANYGLPIRLADSS